MWFRPATCWCPRLEGQGGARSDRGTVEDHRLEAAEALLRRAALRVLGHSGQYPRLRSTQGDVVRFGLIAYDGYDGSRALSVGAYAEHLMCSNGMTSDAYFARFVFQHTRGYQLGPLGPVGQSSALRAPRTAACGFQVLCARPPAEETSRFRDLGGVGKGAAVGVVPARCG